MKKYKLIALLASIILSGAMTGCNTADQSSPTSDSDAFKSIQINASTLLAERMATNREGVFEAIINAGSQAAALAIGAGAEETGVAITAINFPVADGVTWNQVPNSSGLPDCKIGLVLSVSNPSCAIKALLESRTDGATVSGDIEVKTNSQTLKLLVKTEFVGTGNTLLPMAKLTHTTVISPDSTAVITVLNPSDNTVALNNISINIPTWLSTKIKKIAGGVLSQNQDGSSSILYTQNGRAANLTPGQSAQISFDLRAGSDVSDAILAHYSELADNATSQILVVNAANLRNKLTPTLDISAAPGKLNSSVILSDPSQDQTITLKNLANTALMISDIQLNLPTGVTRKGGSCKMGSMLAENGDEARNNCTIILNAERAARSQNNKSLSIRYRDLSGNSFVSQTTVEVASADISIENIATDNAVSIPTTAEEVVDISITNTGKLNWIPSNLRANYMITPEGQSLAAEDIEILDEGLNNSDCLTGNPVLPAESCTLAVKLNPNALPGNYILTVLPSGNLSSQQTKTFSIRGRLGMFQLRDDRNSQLDTIHLKIGQSQTVTVHNIGQTAISNVLLTTPTPLTLSSNTCNRVTLAANASCQFTFIAPDGTGEGDFTIKVMGVSNTEVVSHSIVISTEGITPSVTPLSAIEIPNSGQSISEIVLTNLSDFDWHPSSNQANYEITGEDTSGISLVGTGLSQPYCLSGAIVPPSGSCAIGLQVTSDAKVGNYALELKQVSNLAKAYTIEFDLINGLGLVRFDPQTLSIGKGINPTPQMVTLRNVGNTDITHFYIASPDELTTTNNGCGSLSAPITLATNSSCNFEVSADTSVVNNTYHYSAFGDAQSCINCAGNTTMPVTVGGVTVSLGVIGDNDNIRHPAVGSEVTNLAIINENEEEPWNPSTKTSDYVISCAQGNTSACNTTNIRIVAPISGVNCLSGSPVAPGNICHVGIQTNMSTLPGNYTISLLPAKNLTSQQTRAFTVKGLLGIFQFTDETNNPINSTRIKLGDTQTFKLTNIGETAISELSCVFA